jgi:hypothetical protein
VSLNCVAVVAIEWLYLLYASAEYRKVNDERHAASADHISRDDLVGAGVSNPAEVSLLRQNEGLNFIIC